MIRFIFVFILAFIFVVLDGIEVKTYDKNVIIAYSIEGSSIDNINTIYYCDTPLSCISEDSQYKLSQISVFVNQSIQKRWYIDSKGDTRHIYGTIEISQEPFQLNPWKNLLNKEVEPLMTLNSWSLYLSNHPILTEEDFLRGFQHHIIMLQYYYHNLISGNSKEKQFFLLNYHTLLNKSALYIQSQPSFNNSSTSLLFPILSQILSIYQCDYYFFQGNILQTHECFTSLLSEFHTQPLSTNKTQELSISSLQLLHNYLLLTSLSPNKNDKIIRRLIFDGFHRIEVYLLFVSDHKQSISPLIESFWQHTIPSNQTITNPLVINQASIKLMANYLTGNYLVLHSIIPTIENKFLLKFICFTCDRSDSIFTFYLHDIIQSIHLMESWVQYYHIINPVYSDIIQKIMIYLQYWTSKNSLSRYNIQRLYLQIPLYTSSLCFSLMSIGSMNSALVIFENTIDLLISQPPLNEFELNPENEYESLVNLTYHHEDNSLEICESTLHDLIRANSSIIQVLFTMKSSTLTSTPFKQLCSVSSHVRQASNLLAKIRPIQGMEAITAHSDMYGLFIALMSQLCNAVILTQPAFHTDQLLNQPFSWIEEVLWLREILFQSIELSWAYCIKLSSCDLSIVDQSNGVRGFFLEAYQGVSLIGYLILETSQRITWSVHLIELIQSHELLDIATSRRYVALTHEINHTPIHSEIISIDSKNHINESQTITLSNESNSREESLPIVPEINDRVIRVGIVCNSLSRHSVGRLLTPLIHYLHQDPSFIVYLITDQLPSNTKSTQTGNDFDDVRQYLEDHIPSSQWLFLPPHASLADQITNILDCHLDIVMFTDLLMQVSQFAIAHSVRMGTFQLAFWGHPYTAADPDFIDYFISSDQFETYMLAPRHHAFDEQLIRFSSLSFVLFLPEDHSTQDLIMNNNKELDYQDMLLEGNTFDFIHWIQTKGLDINGHSPLLTSLPDVTIYTCLQSLMKMHPLLDEMVYQLLTQDSHAVILFLSQPKQSYNQNLWQQRLRKYIQTKVQTATDLREKSYEITIESILHRIVWLSPMKHLLYAKVICKSDVVLDPFPFGGGVTLSDAIGQYSCSKIVPFVTSSHLQTVHQIGAGMVTSLQRSHIARNIQINSLNFTDIFQNNSKSFTLDAGDDWIKRWEIIAKELIRHYVLNALELAQLSKDRQERMNITDEMNSESSESDDRRVVFDMLYHENKVFDEYKTFFQQLIRQAMP